MKESATHLFNIADTEFWQRLYMNPDFLEGMHLEGMQCEEFRIERMEGSVKDGFSLCLFSRPKLEIPKALRKVIGDSVTYREHSSYDPRQNEYHFRLETSVLSEDIDILGSIRIEKVAEDKVRRTIDIEIAARIFGVGKILERFIAQSSRNNIEQASRFTTQWLASSQPA